MPIEYGEQFNQLLSQRRNLLRIRSRSRAPAAANAASANGMIGDPLVDEEGTDGANSSATVNAPPAAAFLATMPPCDDDHESKAGTVFGPAHDAPAAGVVGPMVSNAVFAALLLFYFDAERPATNIKEANVLALQMVAFGCVLSTCCFYGMYVQRGRRAFVRMAWAYHSCAQFLSYVGMIFLVSSVAVATCIQLGQQYGGVWIRSVMVTLMLAFLPVICGMGVCTWRLVESLVDWYYQWKK